MKRSTRASFAILTFVTAWSLAPMPAIPDTPFARITSGIAHAAPPHHPHKKFSVLETTISEIQDAIKARQVTCVDVVSQYLERIKAYNGVCVDQPDGPLGFFTPIAHAGQLNALLTLNLRPATRAAWGFEEHKARSQTDLVDDDPAMPDALETAAALDAHFAQTGKLAGPLHCAVMSIKDQFNTFDMRTTAGMDAAFANDRPNFDATFVERLRHAGAIILAKANLGELASSMARSSFGGVLCNPYDTTRNPGHSSGGPGTSVAANLVTCAIGEETGGSILHPTKNNNIYGLVPTQEAISRHGMMDASLITRLGPMCRTVEDAARIFDVIVGYDPNDELTAFSVGRLPERPYYEYAKPRSLKGVRIGVLREYMDPSLWNQADVQSIQIQNVAIQKLAEAGATLVDPGQGHALLQDCVNELDPLYRNSLFTAQFPTQFPADGNDIDTLLGMWFDPSKVPAGPTMRNLGSAPTTGQSTYMLQRYLTERGDSNIKTIADLANKSTFFYDIRPDANFTDLKAALVSRIDVKKLELANYFETRFTYQVILEQCMASLELDAIVSSCGTIPAYVLGQPVEPNLNDRGASAISVLGQQGIPMLGMPAGFTTYVYDRVRDASAPGGTKLVGPVPAKLPVAIALYGRPFSEPLLFKIAAAYERVAHPRVPPPDFGALPAK